MTDDGILPGEPREDATAEHSRLDVLEGRVEELSRHWDRLFGEIGRLDHKIETLGDTLSARIDALDQKFDRRFEAVDRKMDAHGIVEAVPMDVQHDGRRCWT